jgi:hypothetical protein
VLPEAAVAEVRRNLAAKLPEAGPLFEEFLRVVSVQIQRPTVHDRDRADELADAKDVPILAAAIGGRGCYATANAHRGTARLDGIARNVRRCARTRDC